MAIDQELIRAVNESVQEVGYPSTVAIRIIKWLEGMSKGDATRSDMDEFLKTTLESIKSHMRVEGQ